MWFLLLLLAIPVIEIGLFIQIGGLIGVWPTLGLVVLTAVLGAAIVRHQGRAALDDLRRAFDGRGDPARPMAHGALILLAGALLLVPGFFTDAVGVLLLVPPVRAALLRRAAARVRVQGFAYGRPAQPAAPLGEVIEGEFHEIGTTPQPTHRPESRTRH